MHFNLKTFFTAALSFLLPGLGQVFRGKLLWASLWLFAFVFISYDAMYLSAIHCFFIKK
jgi:hypothetical protein